jgi:hypothetical protein
MDQDAKAEAQAILEQLSVAKNQAADEVVM